MSLDIPITLLYIFYAVLQIYIFASVGVITGLKKIWTAKSLKPISGLMVNFFWPIYATLELSRMAKWENVEIMWIIIVSVTFSIFVGLSLSFAIHRLFNLDIRFMRTYPFMLAMPSLGTLPLVFCKALCYPGGMLEGDPQCDSVLGFMMMNFLIFQIIFLILGFILLPKDAAFSNTLMEKMSFLWHILVGKIFDKNYAVLNLFLRFIEDKNRAKQLFEIFDKKYKLIIDDKENLKYKFIDNKEIKFDFDLESISSHEKEHDENNLVQLETKFTKTLPNLTEANEVLPTNKNLITQNHISASQKTPEHINIDILETKIKEKSFSLFDGQKWDDSNNMIYWNEINFIQPILPVPINTRIIDNNIDCSNKQYNKEEEEEKNYIYSKNSRKSSLCFKIQNNDIELYYEKVFNFTEKHLNKTKLKEYEEFKLHTMKLVNEFPPKFPTVYDITITTDMINIINSEWDDYENHIKKINPEFKLVIKEMPITIQLILSKIYSPPILGCFLGIINFKLIH
jgi:hypothetical protein